jgi:hypothetical protein
MIKEASNQPVNILYIYINTFIGRKNINLTAYPIDMLYRLLKFRTGNT